MKEVIKQLRAEYDATRLAHIDMDFLEFEEELGDSEDLELLLQAVRGKKFFAKNPHNSIMLYVLRLTNCFDFDKERSDTKGGSPPDIDIDFEALGRGRAVEWTVNKWGRNNVANIITHGTLKPKSLVRKYYKLTEGDVGDMRDILKVIPNQSAGAEATLEEIVKGTKHIKGDKKGYSAHPELEAPKYSGWLEFSKKLEGMTANFGIHAGGIVISDFPIPETIPCWKNGKSDFITQYDMHEVEELGSIKFDFLVINALDTLKETVRLIEERHGTKYDIYKIPDGDKKTYKLLADGLVTCLFQLETSSSARELTQRVAPNKIPEISDVSALNRPGPMNAGMHDDYVQNKLSGKPPEGMPPTIAELLKGTYWTLVYQEQIMSLVSKIAGFTLQEADDVRRAMGKKKLKVLEPYRKPFIEGSVERGIDRGYAESLWDDTLIGFAEYCFNKSHSMAYSTITYVSAYFKANYPIEFFAAQMSIRSQVLQPKIWAQKAPAIVNDAKHMDISINAPYIQISGLGMTIVENNIYFGLSAIKSVGEVAVLSILAARKAGRFKDVWDFLSRVNRSKVNTKVFEALIAAGTFDKMGYKRDELLRHSKDMYGYLSAIIDAEERLLAIEVRNEENRKKDVARELQQAELKEAKAAIRVLKKIGRPTPVGLQKIVDLPIRLRDYRKRISANKGVDVHEVLNADERAEYEQSIWLRKTPTLKPKSIPPKPEVGRYKTITIDVQQLMEQAEYIGCYLMDHPARVLYPDSTPIAASEEGDYLSVAGQIVEMRQLKTRRGQNMAFLIIGDGTAMARCVVFPREWERVSRGGPLKEGDIVLAKGLVEKVTDTQVNIKLDGIIKYKRPTTEST